MKNADITCLGNRDSILIKSIHVNTDEDAKQMFNNAIENYVQL